ncbi:hypothetical protein ACFX1Z_019398 [Malus domestica]
MAVVVVAASAVVEPTQPHYDMKMFILCKLPWVFSAKLLDPNPSTRITISKVMDLSWFQEINSQSRTDETGAEV